MGAMGLQTAEGARLGAKDDQVLTKNSNLAGQIPSSSATATGCQKALISSPIGVPGPTWLRSISSLGLETP